MKIIIINGPNLNLLGTRQTEIYGSVTMEDFLSELRKKYSEYEIDYFQSNVEGELINKIHEVSQSYDAILINAGAFTHTSIAIGDALSAVDIPAIEVHISNPQSREPYRFVSYLANGVKGSVSGFGLKSYELGILATKECLS